MSDLQFTVRPAAADDEPNLTSLIMQYLIEMRINGSEIVPDTLSVDHYLELYDSIIADVPPNFGVCLIAEDAASHLIGFTLATLVTSALVTDFGQTAVAHGTYVVPEVRCSGVAKALRQRLQEDLRERGFNTVFGGVHMSNDLGARSLQSTEGWTWHQMIGYVRL